MMQAGDISAATRLLLGQSAKQLRAPGATGQWVQVFIEADDVGFAAIQAAGGRIGTRVGRLATARLPMHSIGTIARMAGVKRIAAEQHLSLCNDSALILSNAMPAKQGQGFSMPYTGRGVVVGVIDCGFDFNHINFLASTGRSRIELAYLPADSTGTHPIVGGDTLPGSCYTADQIAALTTDTRSSIHATHTLGTAAGSYTANGYSGVAPEARLVVCGMPEAQLTDANIANSLALIFDYAKRLGLPCVVNMSLGDFSGPHDGTSPLCKVIDELSGPGKICVLSAGNDGRSNVALSHQFTSSADTLGTMLMNRYGGTNISAYVSSWSSDSTAHALRAVVVNRFTGQVLYASPWSSIVPADSILTLDSKADTAFARYFNGQVLMAHAVEDNGKYHTVVSISARYRLYECVLGLQCIGAAGNQLHAWCDSYTRFANFGQPDWSVGNSQMTISDLCTGDSAISVGSYNSRTSPVVATGKVHTMDEGDRFEVSPFSSYGPDMRGINRPDVLAPGSILISSYNRYDTIMAVSDSWVTERVECNGQKYPYGINVGTSMSAPVVTGSIALWLQAHPQLSVGQVRRVLQATSKNDEFTAALPQRSGYGKLDASAGLDYLLNLDKLGDVNNDGLINVSDVTALIELILSGNVSTAQMARADIDSNGVLNVIDVTELINMIIIK